MELPATRPVGMGFAIRGTREHYPQAVGQIRQRRSAPA